MRARHAIVVGAGHNGLVAAIVLARAGLRVTVLEARERVGGAAVTERPFPRAPDLGCSTGAYLLGLMPPELLADLDVRLPLIRRDPHYFLPTTGPRHLVLGRDEAANRRRVAEQFSVADATACAALTSELGAIRDDLAPSWLAPPLPVEETAERYLRPRLRRPFVDLCRGSIAAYLGRFGFRSDLLVAMYAVTDGFPGLDGALDTPGGGMNLLVHNMGRLPGSGCTWMIVQGGMGTVTARLAERAADLGAEVRTGAPVAGIRVAGGAVAGVTLASGEDVDATTVMVNADPFTALGLVPAGALPSAYVAGVQALRRPGTTFKVNLALRDLPRFRSRPGDRGVFGSTIHLLPDEDVVLAELRRAHADARAGRLPDRPAIEMYVHTAVDPSMRDPAGRHSAALFVSGVPSAPVDGWAARTTGYVDHLLALCDRFAPGMSALVDDVDALPPPEIERRFGIAGGHIHHVDNALGFDRRLPYATPVAGLWMCGAGCHPAGSVVGAAGHNAARVVLAGLGATRSAPS